MKHARDIAPLLLSDHQLGLYPQCRELVDLVTGPTETSSAGYPYISESSFCTFIARVPHLYQYGQYVLTWLRQLEQCVNSMEDLHTQEVESIARSVRVLRNVVYTAGVTATPDLWLMRQVLSAYAETGILARLAAGEVVDPETADGFDAKQLHMDFKFMRSRGYLQLKGSGFSVVDDENIKHLFATTTPLPRDFLNDAMDRMHEDTFADAFLPVPIHRKQVTWIALGHELEIGYRLLPFVLAYSRQLRSLKMGVSLNIWTEPAQVLLEKAGLQEDGRVTELGVRVFQRGPGPFGIIGAYHPYMTQLTSFIGGSDTRAWVNRGANVTASQDANRKTFSLANDALDRFCVDTGFEFNVFIEHAVGRGEATRQRFERSSAKQIHYFGADLEDAAIDRALQAQSDGQLPANMQFIRKADIAEPQLVVAALEAFGQQPRGAVMMVGNGFHEVRNQSNEHMVDVFSGYAKAGIVLVFTEESALSDEDLIHTAWNTYHAGFRYVHELSGQGLRPADERPGKTSVYSWRRCAEEAGYVCLEAYTSRTRTIYPYPRAKGYNPAISVTHFCVPADLAIELGLQASLINSDSDRV